MKPVKPKEKMVLLHFNCDWADEFDVEFVTWVTNKWWKQYKKDVEKYENQIFPTECYFGTNEAIYFSSSDEFLDAIESHDITEDQINFLEKISSGVNTIGTTIELEYILDDVDFD